MDQINGLSVVNQSQSQRTFKHYGLVRVPSGRTLDMHYPSGLENVYTGADLVDNSSGRSSGRSSTSSYRSASASLDNTSQNSIVVNIFDGTGQKISQYDSALRIEVKERAARNNEFSALA